MASVVKNAGTSSSQALNETMYLANSVSKTGFSLIIDAAIAGGRSECLKRGAESVKANIVSKSTWIIAAGIVFIEVALCYNDYYNGKINGKQFAKLFGIKIATNVVGSACGALGAGLGATIGTLIFPGFGSIIGSFVGGLLVGISGSLVTEKLL